jgi:hypothetical protein
LQYGDGAGGFTEVTGSSVSAGAVTINPGTSAVRALTLGMTNRATDGQTDSHKFYLTAKGRSASVNYSTEVLQWIDISSDDASDGRYRVQQSYNGGAAVDLFTADAYYGLTGTFLSFFDSNSSNRITLFSGENTSADYSLDYRPNGANRTVSLSGNLTLAANFITSGANSLTLTTTGTTNVTLPTTGTLLSTASNFIYINSLLALSTTAGQLEVGNGYTVSGVRLYGGGSNYLFTDGNGNISLGAGGGLATSATAKFPYVPVMAGTPSGTPTSISGMAPIVVDSSGLKLWVYVGGAWKYATLN